MATIGTILSALGSVLWWVISFLWSILWYLLWVVIWLLLPVAIAGFIALRVAERALGEKAVREWVKARALKYGAGTWDTARRWTFALGVLPLRVLGWLSVYTVWHAFVSILWRPRWTPWQRAWGKRWKPQVRAVAGKGR